MTENSGPREAVKHFEEGTRHFLENGIVRLTTAVAVVAVISTAAVGAGRFLEQNKTTAEAVAKVGTSLLRVTERLANSETKLEELRRDINDARDDVEVLKGKIVGRGPEGWHKSDMSTWCRETELLNGEVRWKCGTIYSGPQY